MYLVHVDTFELRYFPTVKDASAAKYVTLSHRWAQAPDDEPTFQELKQWSLTMRRKPGYLKLCEAANIVRRQGDCDWLWIDTCCINKDFSAELQEGINSMWEIYRQSQWCLVYLSDVTCDPASSTSDRESVLLASNFRTSKWFTRGWTLQELLAPPRLNFFISDPVRGWTLFGRREVLRELISTIIEIPSGLLADRNLELALREPDWRQQLTAQNVICNLPTTCDTRLLR